LSLLFGVKVVTKRYIQKREDKKPDEDWQRDYAFQEYLDGLADPKNQGVTVCRHGIATDQDCLACSNDAKRRRDRRAIIDDFIAYVNKPENADIRFWQAVRNWSNHNFILASNVDPRELLVNEDKVEILDTFYWETKG
jgi:hypothetical protein